MIRAYISGRITNEPADTVQSKFACAKSRVLTLGYEPVSPLDNGLPTDSSWSEHMAKDIELLFSCEIIYMLSCWEHSKGARIEHNIAKERGMTIIYQPLPSLH